MFACYLLKHDFVDGESCLKYTRRQDATSQYVLTDIKLTVNHTDC